MWEWWKRKLIVARVLIQYIGLVFWQKAYLPVVRVRRNVYDVQYVLRDRVYKVRTQVRRVPRVARVFDHEGEDVSDCVLAYLGPNEDFHGSPMTPGGLGYKGLLLRLRDGRGLAFAHDDVIQLEEKKENK